MLATAAAVCGAAVACTVAQPLSRIANAADKGGVVLTFVEYIARVKTDASYQKAQIDHPLLASLLRYELTHYKAGVFANKDHTSAMENAPVRILVVGAAGAGKDSFIRAVQETFGSSVTTNPRASNGATQTLHFSGHSLVKAWRGKPRAGATPVVLINTPGLPTGHHLPHREGHVRTLVDLLGGGRATASACGLTSGPDALLARVDAEDTVAAPNGAFPALPDSTIVAHPCSVPRAQQIHAVVFVIDVRPRSCARTLLLIADRLL